MQHRISKQPGRVSIATLGCKLNQYDSEVILTQFRSLGYEVVDDPSLADVCIVNSCAVTATAERKTRSLLRSIRRQNPSAKVVAAGCMSEHTPDLLAGIPGVDLVLGNGEKLHVLDYLDDLPSPDLAQVHVGETAATQTWTEEQSVSGLLGRTRCFLKVQDGCSQKCTYCIVPRLRGIGRSMSIETAVRQVTRLVNEGFAEIVLTGVALGTYGFDLGWKDGLAKLLAELDCLEGLKRVRLGSIEPWAITEDFLRIVAGSEKICPHLHIPLQSADDSVLHRMNRRYTVASIQHLFDYAYSLRSDWGFGADIITGFPGESDLNFEHTKSFLESSPLAYLHIFPFSSRPGTPAVKLTGHVGDVEKRRRVTELKKLDSLLRLAFRRKSINSVHSVLFEQRHIGDLIAGHAANYLDVYVPTLVSLAGTIRQVRITDLHPEGVIGEIVT